MREIDNCVKVLGNFTEKLSRYDSSTAKNVNVDEGLLMPMPDQTKRKKRQLQFEAETLRHSHS